MEEAACSKGAVVEVPGVGGKVSETLVEAGGGAGFVVLVEGVVSVGIDATEAVFEAIEAKLGMCCFSSINARPLAI
jgi:hypothetical protein